MQNFTRAELRRLVKELDFAYAGLLTCVHCGCNLTAELKKRKVHILSLYKQ